MAGDEFLISAWQQRVNDLEQDRATLHAHLVAARNQGDRSTAGEALEGLAEVDDRLRRLQVQRQQYDAQIAHAPAPNKYGLTPDQQDAARTCGVDDETYARNLQELARRKMAGLYPDGRH